MDRRTPRGSVLSPDHPGRLFRQGADPAANGTLLRKGSLDPCSKTQEWPAYVVHHLQLDIESEEV